jgi:hypothetical protein
VTLANWKMGSQMDGGDDLCFEAIDNGDVGGVLTGGYVVLAGDFAA